MTIPPENQNPETLILLADQSTKEIQIEQSLLQDSEALLDKMDNDMNQGWQLSRKFISSPSRTERCQIVANRLVTAMESENEASFWLMIAYLKSRMPTLKTISLNLDGEAEENMFYDENNCLI